MYLTVVDARYSGVYCLKSNQWLTSSACQILGATAVLSSQASVLTLVSLSSVRLITVLNVRFAVRLIQIYILKRFFFTL